MNYRPGQVQGKHTEHLLCARLAWGCIYNISFNPMRQVVDCPFTGESKRVPGRELPYLLTGLAGIGLQVFLARLLLDYETETGGVGFAKN